MAKFAVFDARFEFTRTGTWWLLWKRRLRLRMMVSALVLVGLGMCYIFNNVTQWEIFLKISTNLTRRGPETQFASQHRINLTTNQSEIARSDDPGSVVCSELFLKNHTEMAEAISRAKLHQRPVANDSVFIEKAADCANFIKNRYILDTSSRTEAQFPLAYSIVLYKHVEQVEMLLRTIYRPQNYYCLHVDGSVHDDVTLSMAAIAKCFDNVFVASRSVDVRWGEYSVLEAELICMEDLLKYKGWRYFINLTGQEFPLKTNWELVQILKSVNGSNLISANIRGTNSVRTKWVHQGLRNMNKLNSRAPYNMTITKGPVHIMATRDFVDYVINDPVALTFRKWIQKTAIPDETFFASLNHNPQLAVPGSFRGFPQMSPTNPHIQRYKIWGSKGKCYGKHRRDICIFGVGDLPNLSQSEKLFANKFHLDYQPMTLICLEELLSNRTRTEMSINLTYYENLEFTHNHVPTSLNIRPTDDSVFWFKIAWCASLVWIFARVLAIMRERNCILMVWFATRNT